MLFKINNTIELPDGTEVDAEGNVNAGGAEMFAPYARLTTFTFDILEETATINVSYYTDWNEQTKATHQRQYTFPFPLNGNVPQMQQLVLMIDGALEQRFKWIKIHEGAERIILE